MVALQLARGMSWGREAMNKIIIAATLIASLRRVRLRHETLSDCNQHGRR